MFSSPALASSTASLHALGPLGDRSGTPQAPATAPDGDGCWDGVAEGPGRRIYDDLTAIDWIFEYTKERRRRRSLQRRTGLTGHLAKMLDSSHIWIVLIGTGVAAGLVAGGIDIVANWLGDLKDGYCSSSFYLSRNFCCWGLDSTSGPACRLGGCVADTDQVRRRAAIGFGGAGHLRSLAPCTGLSSSSICSTFSSRWVFAPPKPAICPL